MDYKRMLEDINEMVGSDFAEDVCSKTSFTNDEACAMSEMIGRIYTIAHQIHCNACATTGGYKKPNQEGEHGKD